MANSTVNFTINLNGTAYTGIAQVDAAMGKLNVTSNKTEKLFDKINNSAFKINNIFQATKNVVGGVLNAMKGFEGAYNVEALANKKLETVMRQRMSATDDQIDAIRRMAGEQQKLGVIGDEVQVSGAQQLATFLNQTDSIETLLPAMNNLLAQQNGLNATEGDAVNIGNLMGKVMQGQTAALTRVGVTFTEAQEKVLKYGNEQQRAAMLAQVITDNVGNMNEAIAGTPEGRLAQVNNRMSDIQERIGGVSVRVREALLPFFEKIAVALESAIGWIETNEAVFVGFFDGIISSTQWLFDTIKNGVPIIIGAIGAILILTTALKWQDLILNILIMKEKAAAIATKVLSGAQAVLNAVMNANPIALIIAGVVFLIGVIAYLCSKITGWGSLWKGVVGFMKFSFFAFVDAIKLYFDTYINGFLIGLDKIKLGWYKFKEAAGLGDSGENQAAIAQINADVEARQKAIIDGAKKVAENANKAKESLGGIEMGWEKSDKAAAKTDVPELGVNSQLMAAVGGGGGNSQSSSVNGNVGNQTGKSTEAVATGGTRSTNITINLKDLVGNMTFSESLADKRDDMVRSVAEAMAQVLNMAQASVG